MSANERLPKGTEALVIGVMETANHSEFEAINFAMEDQDSTISAVEGHNVKIESDEGPNMRFATTQWTLVCAAGAETSAESQLALETLCKRYWHPLYAFIRRRGYSAEQAEDLTQAFFERLLSRKTLKNADPQLGRFRSYLLRALKHFLAYSEEHDHAAKRGGYRGAVSLDEFKADQHNCADLIEQVSPDRAFDRQWAITLLNFAFEKLRNECVVNGKEELFERLHSCLTGENSDARYRQIAQEFKMTEGAVKAAAHRLRQKYRQLVRIAIGETVSSPDEINDEIRHLFTVLKS